MLYAKPALGVCPRIRYHVESALPAHHKVLEAAVVPRPHSVFGEVAHAFVVLTPGVTATEDETFESCKV